MLMAEQLSTAAREQLLQTEREYLARTLDGLYIAGWSPGRQFSEAAALAALKPLGVGRRALRRALEEVQFFPVIAVQRRKLGRPVKLHRLPSPEEAANILDVSGESGDELEPEDMKRGNYKLALHREMIKRRNGEQTSLDWMAGRLHVHRRTIRRFNKKLRIQVEQVFERVLLTPTLAASLPTTIEEIAKRSFWLETMDTKRWRPLQEVAALFFHMRLDALIVHQRPNRYWLPAG
jgi:hypothetical protein